MGTWAMYIRFEAFLTKIRKQLAAMISNNLFKTKLYNIYTLARSYLLLECDGRFIKIIAFEHLQT